MDDKLTRPALFLDRDGIINVDHGYVYRIDEFDFVDGIFELVAMGNLLGFLVVVVTNQAGIGRGYFTEADFQILTDWMKKKFAEQGGKIDAVYHCPYHPEHGIGRYRRASSFRKPEPGMFLQAALEHKINLNNSIMVGDKESDMVAGAAAGIKSLFIYGKNASIGTNVEHLNEIISYLSKHKKS